MTKPLQLTMDMLLKMTPEVFRDTVKSQSLGFNKSLQNLLKAQYEQCNLVKDSIATILEKGDVPEEDKAEHSKALKALYLCMQLIEDRHTILSLVIKEVEDRGLNIVRY